jgi:hypothetical protein
MLPLLRNDTSSNSSRMCESPARNSLHYGRHSRLSEERVRTAVEREAERSGNARVRTFVSILVERAARHDLDTQAP